MSSGIPRMVTCCISLILSRGKYIFNPRSGKRRSRKSHPSVGEAETVAIKVVTDSGEVCVRGAK